MESKKSGAKPEHQLSRPPLQDQTGWNAPKTQLFFAGTCTGLVRRLVQCADREWLERKIALANLVPRCWKCQATGGVRMLARKRKCAVSGDRLRKVISDRGLQRAKTV